MSQQSVLKDRMALWATLLQDWGYTPVASPQRQPRGTFDLRATRLPAIGDPPVTIRITESWRTGADPEALAGTTHGCHLHEQSWHAQIGNGTGERGAERLDVDRKKAKNLRIHRHPHKQPNDVRHAAPLMRPEEWMDHVETVVYEA